MSSSSSLGGGDRPRVSVVIPAFRAATTIGKAIDSVIAQTSPVAQILVVDDGSPDDLGAVVSAYGAAVQYCRKANGGAASARNLGIDRCDGDWVAFLDADDYWEPDKLRRQLEVADAHPEVGLIAGRYFEEEPGGVRAERRGEASRFLGRPLRPSRRETFEFATTIWTSTIIVRREVLGEHRFENGLEPAEDRDLWVRLVTSTPVYLLPEPLATAVLTPGSLSRSHADGDYPQMLRVVRRHAELLGRRGRRSWEAKVYGRWASVHLGGGRPGMAIAPAWDRLLRQPLSPQGWWVLSKCLALAVTSRSPRDHPRTGPR